MALIESHSLTEQPHAPALAVPEYVDMHITSLFLSKIAPYYSRSESPEDTHLVFSAQKISLYQGVGNKLLPGASLYASHADKKDAFMTASFNSSGASLESFTVSRTPHRTELQVVERAMKEIRLNLSSFVHEYNVDPLILLSALPTKR